MQLVRRLALLAGLAALNLEPSAGWVPTALKPSLLQPLSTSAPQLPTHTSRLQTLRPSALNLQCRGAPPPPPSNDQSLPGFQGRKVPPPPKRRGLNSRRSESIQDPNKPKEMEGLFYYDEVGNPRKMKFSFDMTREDPTLEERYYEWEENPMLARKGDEEWDEWRKRASDWMFFDQARVYVKGGDGGAGEVAFRREAHVDMGGPFGGNGGDGGNVIFVADEGDNTLATVRANLHQMADSGKRGGGKTKDSPRAPDLIVRVPLGTIVRDDKTGVLVADMSQPNQQIVVSKGGKGGRGNYALRTPQNKAPSFAELGEKGKGRWLQLQLKLVADVGIIGVPNAGKSSFLSSVTNAKPKVAAYPFTTVVPNLGVCELPGADRRSIVLADIPGLLEGAHDGRGLGQQFLRHIERCRVLLHIIDGSAEDPIYNYKAIQNELELFNPELAEKPQVVLVNKMDIPEVRERWPALREELKQLCGHSRVAAISAAANKNTLPTLVKVRTLIDELPAENMELTEKTEEELLAEESLEQKRRREMTHTVVRRSHNIWELMADRRLERVSSSSPSTQWSRFGGIGTTFWVEYWAQHIWLVLPDSMRSTQQTIEMTNFENVEAEDRFFRILHVSGVRDVLEDAGVNIGDTVILGGWEFEYREDKNMMQVLAREDGFYD